MRTLPVLFCESGVIGLEDEQMVIYNGDQVMAVIDTLVVDGETVPPDDYEWYDCEIEVVTGSKANVAVVNQDVVPPEYFE